MLKQVKDTNCCSTHILSHFGKVLLSHAVSMNLSDADGSLLYVLV